MHIQRHPGRQRGEVRTLNNWKCLILSLHWATTGKWVKTKSGKLESVSQNHNSQFNKHPLNCVNSIYQIILSMKLSSLPFYPPPFSPYGSPFISNIFSTFWFVMKLEGKPKIWVFGLVVNKWSLIFDDEMHNFIVININQYIYKIPND